MLKRTYASETRRLPLLSASLLATPLTTLAGFWTLAAAALPALLSALATLTGAASPLTPLARTLTLVPASLTALLSTTGSTFLSAALTGLPGALTFVNTTLAALLFPFATAALPSFLAAVLTASIPTLIALLLLLVALHTSSLEPSAATKSRPFAHLQATCPLQ